MSQPINTHLFQTDEQCRKALLVDDPDACFDVRECQICHGLDRIDFVIRRYHESGYSCKFCRQPGNPSEGGKGFSDPHELRRPEIQRKVNQGWFDRYERLA